MSLFGIRAAVGVLGLAANLALALTAVFRGELAAFALLLVVLGVLRLRAEPAAPDPL